MEHYSTRAQWGTLLRERENAPDDVFRDATTLHLEPRVAGYDDLADSFGRHENHYRVGAIAPQRPKIDTLGIRDAVADQRRLRPDTLRAAPGGRYPRVNGRAATEVDPGGVRAAGRGRVQLVGGAMVCKEPQYSPHATSILLVQRVLTEVFGAGWVVRSQMPVALDDESEPEPDVAVVRGDPRDYRDAHPTRPVLVVEVALSRLAFDRERKGSLYWIVNLPDRRLEAYRGPVHDGAAPFGWRYGTARALGPGERVAPLAAPEAGVTVADLLP